MKKIFFFPAVMMLLGISCYGQQRSISTSFYDLSTPEHAWQSLLTALKTGETAEVKNVTTDSGFQSLIQVISPSNEPEPFESVFQYWGKAWNAWEMRWEIAEGNLAKLRAGPAAKEHGFTFILIGSEWKMHVWKQGD